MEVLPNIDPFRERYNEVELQLSEPDVFKDAFRASSLNREFTRLRKIIEIHNSSTYCQQEIESTKELIDDPELGSSALEEIDLLNKRLEELESNLILAMLPEEADTGKNTIVEIRAGAGGDAASNLNLVYNLADFVNKIAFGVVIWVAATSSSKA